MGPNWRKSLVPLRSWHRVGWSVHASLAGTRVAREAVPVTVLGCCACRGNELRRKKGEDPCSLTARRSTAALCASIVHVAGWVVHAIPCCAVHRLGTLRRGWERVSRDGIRSEMTALRSSMTETTAQGVRAEHSQLSP